MRKTLYLKLILAYIIFGLFGFVVVATFVANMTLDHLKKEHSESLYREATFIANTYATDLYKNEISLEAVKVQLDALDAYTNAVLWIINPSGRLVLDSSAPLDLENEIVIENFDSTVTAGSNYVVGNFFNTFEEDMLSVFAPITADYKVKGYVVIHMPMGSIQTEANSMLTISYLMLVILFLLSLIILILSQKQRSSTPAATCIMNSPWKVKTRWGIWRLPCPTWQVRSPAPRMTRRNS